LEPGRTPRGLTVNTSSGRDSHTPQYSYSSSFGRGVSGSFYNHHGINSSSTSSGGVHHTHASTQDRTVDVAEPPSRSVDSLASKDRIYFPNAKGGCYFCTVGRKRSAARFFVPDSNAVMSLLSHLIDKIDTAGNGVPSGCS